MTKAYRITELATMGPFKRSTIYNLIRSGDLVAKRIGRSTFVMAEDWAALIDKAPAVTPDRFRPRRRTAIAASASS
jgi:hypothetical protein